MFGFIKSKKQKNSKAASGKSAVPVSNVGKDIGQKSASDLIREQALANVRAARENLGEETINRIAEALKKKQQQSAAMDQARNKLANADAERVASEILSMLETRTRH